MSAPLLQSSLRSLKKLFSGKVRDIYEIDANRLLLIATDRLSAYDVVFPQPIPGKGKILTKLSCFWFAHMKFVPNHLLPEMPESIVAPNECDQVIDRAVVVRRTTPLPIEAVVRGYLAGSGWKDYQKNTAVCNIPLPHNLEQSSILPEPIFTPASKAALGEHDQNINFETVIQRIGSSRAQAVRDLSLRIYNEAWIYAKARNILIADTKFEFGIDANGQLCWIDEALTPDSSRYWPASEYRTGISPPSFDKQFVRDYLESTGWSQSPPAPALPDHIIKNLAEKYDEIYTRLTRPTN